MNGQLPGLHNILSMHPQCFDWPCAFEGRCLPFQNICRICSTYHLLPLIYDGQARNFPRRRLGCASSSIDCLNCLRRQMPSTNLSHLNVFAETIKSTAISTFKAHFFTHLHRNGSWSLFLVDFTGVARNEVQNEHCTSTLKSGRPFEAKLMQGVEFPVADVS